MDQRREEAEVVFEQPRADYEIAVNQLPSPSQNIHYPRS
jgi:hypothetical protein